MLGHNYGGGLYAGEASEIIIENCKFINNTADFAGAVFIHESSKVIFKNNLFLRN